MRWRRPCSTSYGVTRIGSTVSAKRSSQSGSSRTGGTRVVRNAQQRDRPGAWWRGRGGREEKTSSAARASGTRTSPVRHPAGTRNGAVPCAGKALCARRTVKRTMHGTRMRGGGPALPMRDPEAYGDQEEPHEGGNILGMPGLSGSREHGTRTDSITGGGIHVITDESDDRDRRSKKDNDDKRPGPSATHEAHGRQRVP